MKHWFYCLLLSLSSTLALGQEVEQLHAELDKVTTDTARARVLSQLSEAYRGVDSARVFDYGYQALDIYQRMDNLEGTGLMYRSLGSSYYRYFSVEEAKERFSLSKTKFEQLLADQPSKTYREEWAKSAFNYSVMLGELGLVDQEIENYIAISRVLKEHPKLLALTHTNLATRFANIKQYDKAYNYYVEGSDFYQKASAKDRSIRHQLMFASSLFEMDSLDRMRTLLDEVSDDLDTASTTMNHPLYYLVNGEYYAGRKDYRTALARYDTAYQLATSHDMVQYLKEILGGYVDTYLSLKDYEQARKYLIRYAEEANKHDSFINDPSVLEKWIRYEIETQNYREAVAQLQRLVRMKDSLNNLVTQRRINELAVAYQTEQKEQEISALEQQNYQASLALEKERYQRHLNLLILGSLMVALLSGGYVFFRKKAHETKVLEQERQLQVQQLRHQQQTQVLSALIEGQEKERQRLASDLHDGLAGRLSGIAFTLSKFTNAPPRTPTVRDVQRVRDHINSSLDELRYIARNLTPQTLSEDGLEVALKDYCSSLEGSDSHIILQYYDTEAPPEASVSLTLYRIVQELIHNAVKYARASEILVQYIREGPRIEITVEDDGVGFDPTHSSSGSQMGLTNIRTRVDYLNGQLEIQSAPGEGTTVWVQVRLPAPSSKAPSSPA